LSVKTGGREVARPLHVVAKELRESLQKPRHSHAQKAV
jgi:hypothetical protein